MSIFAGHDWGTQRLGDLFDENPSIIQVRFKPVSGNLRVYNIRFLRGHIRDRDLKRNMDLINHETLMATIRLEDLRKSEDLKGSDIRCIEKNFKDATIYVDNIRYDVDSEYRDNGNFGDSIILILRRVT